MSKCDLQIEFDQATESFRAGDTVSGKVAVLVNKNCTCRDLEIRLVWKTHGRGNRKVETIAADSVFSGEWQSGQRHTHDFSFTFPDGPPSYHGDYLNVVWAVEAQADIPWAFDPKAEKELQLEAGPAGYVHDISPPELPAIAQAMGCIIAIIVFSAFLLFPLVPIGFIVTEAIKTEDPNLYYFLIPVLAFEGVMAIVMLFVAMRIKALKRPFARRVVGEVQFELDTQTYYPGDTVPLRIAFTPRRLSGIRDVHGALRCVEQVVSGSGTDRRTHTKQVYQEQLILTAPPDFRVGYPVEYTGELSIPKTAAPSFYTSDNALLWTIDVHIDIARWLDWEDSRTLIIGCPPAKT